MIYRLVSRAMNIRVGFGYDVHQLALGEELWLGGILLAHEKGAVGHSDADVLLHVICDALLGAANMRDIGFHYFGARHGERDELEIAYGCKCSARDHRAPRIIKSQTS